MTFERAFLEPALREWKQLDPTGRDQYKATLAERIEHPRVPSAELHGHPDRDRIKLRGVGYRLVYEVRDSEVVVLVVAVGRREGDAVYLAAMKR
ncbi:type II toxin-antitoxin system RelE family toxin [Burkholderia seminalis]|uniref:type II toxin-antitoxin system RelE family toxin n=1 Tax=Burkholderia seminalis TaxID=488731 RepID=UPI00084F841D|nr:type II toxin-antitoxin system RelE/ParE family toxin [Burkholderia seminalis]MBJ9589022.1 type II toxin-antitoxin system RelE/ParE family toxin [Burkholderia seminalis]